MIELSLKEYATKHKISIFNTMKLAKAGSIASETRMKDGKPEIIILTDEAPQVKAVETEEMDYKKAYLELKKKYDALLRSGNGK